MESTQLCVPVPVPCYHCWVRTDKVRIHLPSFQALFLQQWCEGEVSPTLLATLPPDKDIKVRDAVSEGSVGLDILGVGGGIGALHPCFYVAASGVENE